MARRGSPTKTQGRFDCASSRRKRHVTRTAPILGADKHCSLCAWSGAACLAEAHRARDVRAREARQDAASFIRRCDVSNHEPILRPEKKAGDDLARFAYVPTLATRAPFPRRRGNVGVVVGYRRHGCVSLLIPIAFKIVVRADFLCGLTPALTGGPSNARPVRLQRVVRRHDHL